MKHHTTVRREIFEFPARAGRLANDTDDEEDRAFRSLTFNPAVGLPSINRKNRHVAIASVTRFASNPLFLLFFSLFLTVPKISSVCTIRRREAHLRVSLVLRYASLPHLSWSVLSRQTGRDSESWGERGTRTTVECKSPAFREPRGHSGFAVDPIAFIGAPSFFSLPIRPSDKHTSDARRRTLVNFPQLNASALHCELLARGKIISSTMRIDTCRAPYICSTRFEFEDRFLVE